ncbi:hypothetical protein [Methylobacterium trifolii]|uniref:Uncharacterized protein n=1 Tax=Methylobacterium trifolii TaxID=1003092 RepID=A0ABQ4TV97_9HYPH|nr:hypothetical protein [Methylobacterium trifolii]GJE58623.1 hypothetical protein MPOCJGCO_0705 [Methylobacterium trifolii]
MSTVSQPAIHHVIRALGEDGRAGALGLAEHAVEMFLAAAPTQADRSLAHDILLRDLAGLRGVAPYLAGFVGKVEAHVGRLRSRPVVPEIELPEIALPEAELPQAA